MGSYNKHALYTAILSANLLTAVGFNPVLADETSVVDAPRLDAVIVTGTRAQERTASASLSPIDVISGESLRSTGSDELGAVLARLIPSINFPRPSLVDGAELIRPAQLRGLSPDQVLVLVNGKRRHTSAFVNLGGAVGRGSAPADLNAIPLSAVDHIEVLRDGASARYGSDAIAGVINVILKHADHGGSISTKFGEYKKGDGIQRNVSGNTGLALGDNGFINLSAEGADNDYTNRAAMITAQAASAPPPTASVCSAKASRQPMKASSSSTRNIPSTMQRSSTLSVATASAAVKQRRSTGRATRPITSRRSTPMATCR